MTKDELIKLVRSQPNREPYRGLAEGMLTATEMRELFNAAPQPLPTKGPGTELKRLLAEVGLVGVTGCGCNSKATLMDRNGVQWCRDHTDEIACWLAEAAVKTGWANKAVAGARLILQPWFRVLEPYHSIIQESIRRAES